MQEHRLFVLVLMDILIRSRDTKIVASDMLPRLRFRGQGFTLAVGSLITASCHTAASKKGMERKRKEENPWPLRLFPNL